MNGVAAITASDRGQADAALMHRLRQAQAERERTAWLRRWLEQIAATLPEARQRLFDLFVTRGLDDRSAARELGTNVAEVRRLRHENRQAILRAFEVTALAAGEAGLDQPGSAPGCGELRQILADAQRNGDPPEGARPDIIVLPAALRLTVTRHLSECGTCQGRRDGHLARWAPEMLPILAGTELSERVTEGLHTVPQLARSRDTPGAHRRVAPVGTSATAGARRLAAAAGAGLFLALLLLAFVWPGFLHGTPALVPRDSAAPAAQDPSSSGAPKATGTIGGVPERSSGRQARTGSAGLLSSLPPAAAGTWAGPSMFASPAPTVPSGVESPTSTPTTRRSPWTSPTSSTPSPSPSATQRTGVPSTPSPTKSPSSTPSPTKSPSPTTSPTTSPSPTPSPSVSPSSTPSPATSPTTSPSPTTSTPSAPTSSAAPQPTPTPSTPTPS